MTATTSTRRLMGTTATVIVNGGSMSAGDVFDRLDRLESCWSRFRPESELTRLNGAVGRFTVVSDALFELIDHLVAAHRLTGGRFDPTVHDQLVTLGYDRTYRELSHVEGPTLDAHERVTEFTPGGGCETIVLVPSSSMVLIPPGSRLDPGGLGKGLAGDLVADQTVVAGAQGVLVEIGGDVVTRGVAPGGGPWRVAIPATPSSEERTLELTDGALATSDSSVRRWVHNGAAQQHIVDPATGRSLTGRTTATVIAGSGWWAEAVATSAIVSRDRNDGWLDEDAARRLGVTVYVDEHESVDA